MKADGIAARGVDRENLVEWVRATVSGAASLSRPTAVERHVSPGGIAVSVRFDDADLARSYCDRFLDVPSGAAAEPDLGVDVLSGKDMPPLASWTDASFEPPAFHATLLAAGLRATYPFQDGIWRLCDLRTRRGLQWCSSRDRLPPWDGSAPLRHHLHWLLDDRSMRFAHAATLGLNDRGIVLFGRGGAGKSGTTLAGLAAGLSTVGDDYVALASDPIPLAKPLYRTVKQDRDGLSRIPRVAAVTAGHAENWRGKVEFDPGTVFEHAFVDVLPIRAAVVPRIAHAEKPALVPTRAQAVMLSLMTSNLHQFAGEPDDGMAFFARFLKDLPCYRLDLSPDAARNGDLLRAFIEGLPGR